jgi:hypothetical protein
MTKTGQQIEDDIYELLNSGPLPSIVNGTVYKFGMRPKDSKLEDAIVRFVTGLDGEIQEGVVVVNIYVLDFDAYQDGIMRKDITRCTELEIAAREWVKSLTTAISNYKFKLAKTIYTEEEPELKQHFVSVKLKFRLTTF